MPLDEEFQALITKIAAMTDLPTIDKSPITDLRRSYEERYIARGPVYEEVGSIEEIEIPAKTMDIPARLYTPIDCRGSEDALVIYFHGGGYVLGNISAYDQQSRAMANRIRAKVLTIDYRLAPENKYPAAVEDAVGAVLWAFDHAEEYGCAPDKITTAGDSAGGALAVVATLAARKENRLVASQILLYPSLNWRTIVDKGDGFSRYPSLAEFSKGYLLDWTYTMWFTEQYFSCPEHMLESNAGNFSDEELVGLPPTLLVTGGYDPLRDPCAHFGERLVRAGVELTYRNFSDLVHNFVGYAGVVKRAGSAFEEVCELSKRLIK